MFRIHLQVNEQHNPVQVSSEISLSEFSVAYSQINVHRITAKVSCPSFFF